MSRSLRKTDTPSETAYGLAASAKSLLPGLAVCGDCIPLHSRGLGVSRPGYVWRVASSWRYRDGYTRDEEGYRCHGPGRSLHFSDLSDGPAKIEVEMLCFSTATADVTISPATGPGKWELTLLPLDQITKLTKLAARSRRPRCGLRLKHPRDRRPRSRYRSRQRKQTNSLRMAFW